MTIHHSPLEHRYSMFALTFAVIIGLVLSYLVALPFLPALVWSLTLAVLFAPVERLLRSKIRMSCVSVPLTMALAALMIVLAAGLVAGALGAQVVKGAGLIGAMLSAESWLEIARRHPALAPAIQWVTSNIELQQLLQSFAAQLGTWGAGLIRGSASRVVNLLLTFYFLFYLLRDKEMILAAISRLVPLSDVEFRILANRMVRTIFASIYGTAAVASLQGVLGGLMFWWLDLPSPVFWGVIMGLLAIIPFLGAFVVWMPAAIALALDGQLLSALMLTLWGMIVVGLFDNIVYPILVGRQLAMHSMLSFIAIIGGLFLFGTYGIVLGPLIVAGSQTLLELLQCRLDVEQAESPAIN